MSENKMNIQWYPGHMAKARRMLADSLKLVDVVIEMVDARAPASTRNPDFDAIFGTKPRVIVLNKADLADPAATKAWIRYYQSAGWDAISFSANAGKGVKEAISLVERAVRPTVERMKAKGVNKTVRAMIVGIPNVGKSTFINQVAGRKGAKAENRPGVTRGKQWITVDQGLLLLDTPGILWPKFEDPEVGMRLAYTGAVKEDVIDTETLACHFMELLAKFYPQTLLERYKLEAPEGADGYDLLQLAGKKRGYLVSGGEVNTERMAKALMDDYRSGKLGKLTLIQF